MQRYFYVLQNCKLIAFVTIMLGSIVPYVSHAGTDLEQGWFNPPISSRLRAYWWWLNGNVTKEAISRDLKEMKAKGFGGAVIMDADGSNQNGNEKVPHGPTFASKQWTDLFVHSLKEANRLGLEISLNIQSGWNLGGPMVTAEDAVKKFTWSTVQVDGGNKLTVKLPRPPINDNFYRDVCLLAWPVKTNHNYNKKSLSNYKIKALIERPSLPGPNGWALVSSAPETAQFLLGESPVLPGEEDAISKDIIELSKYLKITQNDTICWDFPPGKWQILRCGYTLADWRKVSTHSDGWAGYAIDVLSKQAFINYWMTVVDPLLKHAGNFPGNTLKYLHTDSWEIEVFNWTPSLPEEFSKRRGYRLEPWLPVLAGFIVNNREESSRFLEDFRRTIGDLAADNHYRVFAELAHNHGLLIHPESGGPHYTPIDAQQCLGINDIPMSEFWAAAKTHRTLDRTRFFIKQPASAAHTMGKAIVAAEGFTTIGPHWQERIWPNLKPSFDQALCEGMNLLVWHAVVCSPPEMGIPGQQYFAGTHFNPNTTWWPMSEPFLAYINRCQYLLQQGLFVADVCYYYGDLVPNFTQTKRVNPAHVPTGYDYDVISAEALINRASVSNGKLVLPNGMSYEMLVLPDHKQISLPVLHKIEELASKGALIIGHRPVRASGLANYPTCDKQVHEITSKLWNSNPNENSIVRESASKAKVIKELPVGTVLEQLGIKPDIEILSAQYPRAIDFIHRRTDDSDIYFLANLTNIPQKADIIFRVCNRSPELWDPVTAKIYRISNYTNIGSRTSLQIEFNPFGSCFVVFRNHTSKNIETNQAILVNANYKIIAELTEDWTVHFNPRWGGPKTVVFDRLMNWISHTNPGIKYYSGSALYEKQFILPSSISGHRIFLNLGDVREIASVKVNNINCGVVWCPPFRVEITRSAKVGTNNLEIEVINFWPNRIIGDLYLPTHKKYTRTNIRTLNRNTPLMDSGLLGPINIELISQDK